MEPCGRRGSRGSFHVRGQHPLQATLATQSSDTARDCVRDTGRDCVRDTARDSGRDCVRDTALRTHSGEASQISWPLTRLMSVQDKYDYKTAGQ